MASNRVNRQHQLQPPLPFEGRVHKWEQRWLPIVKNSKGLPDEVRLELLRWVKTNQPAEQPKGPRRPHLRPVTSERNKPVQIPSLQPAQQAMQAPPAVQAQAAVQTQSAVQAAVQVQQPVAEAEPMQVDTRPAQPQVPTQPAQPAVPQDVVMEPDQPQAAPLQAPPQEAIDLTSDVEPAAAILPNPLAAQVPVAGLPEQPQHPDPLPDPSAPS